MNARFWANVNMQQEMMIAGSTSLKMQVVLFYRGVRMECATVANKAQVRMWIASKIREWSLHTPQAVVGLGGITFRIL
jgi:hypothetical protein